MIKIIVGDVGPYLATIAKSIDPTAFLINKQNYRHLRKNSDITAYVSPGDLPKTSQGENPLYEVLKQADEIVYAPPVKWSDSCNKFQWHSQQYTIEFFLCKMQKLGKIVKNLDLSHYLEHSCLYLENTRIDHTDSNLWIVGGSDSHGAGILREQTYGNIVSQTLCKKAVFLTKPGCSLEYSADQILRSDIQSNDIVIWGLTPETRAPEAINGKIKNLHANSTESLDCLLSETRFYKAMISIFQVKNFLKKINCQLILLPICSSEVLQLHIMHLNSYCEIPINPEFPKYTDYGNDQRHPGPKQHQVYADLCLQFLQKFNN